ncbi:MAG TPA: glycosyltransferase, partial [Chthoniobacteraceae bacterium]
GGKSFPPGVHSLYPPILARLYHSRFHTTVDWLAPRDRWTDRAFRRLAESPYDLIHLHNFHGRYASIESLAVLARAKPLVWTFHALWGVTGGCDHPRDCRRYLNACGQCPQLNRWPLGPIDNTAAQLEAKLRLLAPLPLPIISPSQWMAETIRTSFVGRNWNVCCIPNAVDAEFVRAVDALSPLRDSPDRPVILIVNRNFRDEQKGFPIVREALRELAKRNGAPAEKLPLVLLAGGDCDWAARHLSGWNCETHGYLTDPAALARLHARANLFLFASPAENFPCVVLEAMAAGACVVATPTGGVVEQIQSEINGLLAREISGPALADALQAALQDLAACAKMGAAAQERVRREYSEDVFAARHQELYTEALTQWKSAP